CLRAVWQGQEFSAFMTSLLHPFPGENEYEARLRQARLRDLVTSRAVATAFAESYVGLARARLPGAVEPPGETSGSCSVDAPRPTAGRGHGGPAAARSGAALRNAIHPLGRPAQPPQQALPELQCALYALNPTLANSCDGMISASIPCTRATPGEGR